MPQSRLLAIGDIHGCDVALEHLLRELAPIKEDTVVILGDVVDRGPGSRQSIEQLVTLKDACTLVFIRGNHEEMMLDALERRRRGGWGEAWLRYGGAATLFSYDNDAEKISQSHREFLASSIDYWETETELFVHANLKPDVALDQQPAEWLRWTHLTGNEAPHPSGKRVICGHTPQKSGEPLVRPGWIDLDTYAWGGGWLTGLDVLAGTYVQTSESGRMRTGEI